MPVVNLPDGTRINFPDGTPAAEMEAAIQAALGGEDVMAQARSLSPQDAEIARTKNDPLGEYLRAQATTPQAGETPEETSRRQYGGLGEQAPVGGAEGAARAYLQGAAFGGGDELVAAGAAGLNRLTGKDPMQSFNELYRSYLARERGKLGQFREASPVTAYGAEIVGALPTAIATAPASVPASTMGRVGLGAATGAAQGGVYGFGAGEEGGRLPSAAQGAAFGGAIGAVAPAIGSGVRNVVERVRTGRDAASVGMPRPAYNVMQRAASADDTLTGAGAQNIQRAGEGAMLADAGPNMRQLLDVAMQKSGRAATQARQAIAQRATEAGQQLTQLLDDVLGAPQGITATSTALRRGTQAARSTAYDAAYARPINYADDVGRQIEDIVVNRVPKSAIKAANRLMRVEGKKSNQIMATFGQDGSVTYQRMPDVRQLDYITRGLQEVAEAQNAKGALGGTTATGRAYGNLKTELRSLVREAVPEYGNALDTAADPISKRSALQIGRQALSARVARDEFAEQLAGMGQAERQYVAQGIRSQLDDAMANVKRALTDSNMDAREAIKAVQTLTTRSSREKMEALLGPERAGQLFDSIDRSLAAFELRAAVVENSKTFARMALSDEIASQTDEGVVNAIRSGEPVNAVKRATQVVGGRTAAAKQAASDQTYSALADALTGPRGASALDLVNAMAAAQARTVPAVERSGMLAEYLARAHGGVTSPLLQATQDR